MKNQTANGRNGNGHNAAMLNELFVNQLKDIYWAEKHLTKVLPKMQKAATSEELQEAIKNHLEETEGHVKRLENVFEILGKKAVAKKCEAMAGITAEGDSVVEETEEGTSTRDAGIIMAAQKVEHYEMATYGSLRQLAKTLGYNKIADILDSTLEEEKNADATLTNIAESTVNAEALHE